MAGCAKALAGNLSGATPSDSTGAFRTKGISYFGPRIVDRWPADFGSLAQAEQIGALVQRASLPIAESGRDATQAIKRFSAEAAPADRALASST